MRRLTSLFLPIIGLYLAAGAAMAAPIGNATMVKPQASLETLAGTIGLGPGATVEANNRVITGEGGEARLRFLDASLLDVGSNAAVTLDEFVYDGAKASRVALTMTLGAFRWVSGASPKGAYDLKTPLATIGVRGTELNVETSAQRSTIRLRAGSIRACSRISNACANLVRAGQGVHIDADGRLELFEERAQQAPLMMNRAARPPGTPPRAAPPRQRAQRQQAAPIRAGQRVITVRPETDHGIVRARPAQRLSEQRRPGYTRPEYAMPAQPGPGRIWHRPRRASPPVFKPR